MLTIRNAQLTAMKESRLREFELRLANEVRQAHPQLAISYENEKLLAVVRDATGVALSLGFVVEAAIRKFVTCTLAQGPGFERASWAQQILRSGAFTHQEKIEHLEAGPPFEGRR